MRRSTAAPSAAWQERALVSRRVSHACSSGIATPIARRIIGQRIKQECKRRAAELRDEALFKDPPPKEECPICFLPMPEKLIYCISLPPATILSVPIFDLAQANEALANMVMEVYYTCCGTNICGGCVYSFAQSGNEETCPFCKARTGGKTHDDRIGEVMKRVDVNDAGAMYILGSYYTHGHLGLQQDLAKGVELWTQAAKLGSSKAHFALGVYYCEGGDLKKVKFHYEAAAMAGHEEARSKLGGIEGSSGNVELPLERAVKHWIIAASAGHHIAMHILREIFEEGIVSRDVIDSTLTAYNNSCAEMRSEARDAYIGWHSDHTGER